MLSPSYGTQTVKLADLKWTFHLYHPFLPFAILPTPTTRNPPSFITLRPLCRSSLFVSLRHSAGQGFASFAQFTWEGSRFMPLTECPALTNMLTDLSSRGRRSARGFVSGKKKKKGRTDGRTNERMDGQTAANRGRSRVCAQGPLSSRINGFRSTREVSQRLV